MVVEHIHGMVSTQGHWHSYAEIALEILLTLVKKITFPLVDDAWINALLKHAVEVNMSDDAFTLLLALSARRKEEDAAVDAETPPAHVREGDTDQPGETATSDNPTPEYVLFSKISQNIQTRTGGQEGGWQDEVVYGGLIAVRDIPRLGSCLPEVEFLQTLSKAMGREESKPFRVRKAAHDVVLVARNGWLKSAELHPTLKNLDFPRKLHSVMIETGRSDHQVSFLKMVEILSEERYWHPYLREAMDIWLPFHRAGRDQVLHILTNVGELLLPRYDGSNPPFDSFIGNLVADEWAGLPGRLLKDLTASRLEPLAEVTRRFKELLFTEIDRRAVLAVVEQVIPSLERRRDDGYDGPGEDIRGIVDDLRENLRTPMRRSTYWI